jgi:hypothetical protein
MKTFKLPYDITVQLYPEGVGYISSRLYKDKHTTKTQEDLLESLIVAHACEGIDIESPAYVQGLRSCLEALANNS